MDNERVDPFYSDGAWMTVYIIRNWFTGEYMPNPTDHKFPLIKQGDWVAKPVRLLSDKYGKPRFYL